ncbi:hypothetical protein LTR56_013546 [Elasticomyces elasticus]|nr:hypothetical protein LTR56_013546 [Elasticomyces elasticus]KAK3651010.1 hypothetical protein LTR22_012258 [Elasticomyces elasticus]KAK4931088.1 hypothetical protein LTR49_002504 [Elasticomyces elasticus]KAK5765556.1 hypothetical protein LTS12_004308 [Elasticomyces elasticus]
METFAVLAALVAAVVAKKYTELSPAQSSEILYKLETLQATRTQVISVQDAVRSELPADTFPNPEVGPFEQQDYASLQQAEKPKFMEAPWFKSLDKSLQSAFRTLEAPALAIERSVINEVVPITNGPAFPVASTFATLTRSA